MSDNEIIEELRREIRDLKTQLSEFRREVETNWKSSAEHFTELYARHKKTHDIAFAMLDDHGKAMQIDRNDGTANFAHIYKRLGDLTNKITTLYDIAIPLELEIFPEIGKARLTLNDMFEKPESDDKP